jgi:Fanconi anemia group J protein
LDKKDSDRRLRVFSAVHVIAELHNYGLNPEAFSAIETAIEDFSNPGNKVFHISSATRDLFQKLLMVLNYICHKGFLQDYRVAFVMDPNTRKTNLKSRIDGSVAVSNFSIEFWCLNSRVIFTEIGRQCDSIILTSGTLSPLESYKMELGISFANQLEANHVITSEQLWAACIPFSVSGEKLLSNFDNLSQVKYQDDLGMTLLRIFSRITVGGVLVFLPSYSSMKRLTDRWQETKIWEFMGKTKDLYMEPSGVNSKERVAIVASAFTASCKSTGSVMFCVYRGKMSEGADFSDELARCVICVGIPFPNVKNPRLLEIKKYHEQNHSQMAIMTGDYWYKTLAFRALNQALGRCIRHQNDWGAVILLDSRFSGSLSHLPQLLPKWFRQFFKAYPNFREAEANLVEFFKLQQMAEVQNDAIETDVLEIV